MSGQLHQRVGQAPLALPIIGRIHATGQRLQCGAQRGATLGIEKALENERAVAARKELQRASFDEVHLLGEIPLGVGGVPGVRAVLGEPADAVLLGLTQ